MAVGKMGGCRKRTDLFDVILVREHYILVRENYILARVKLEFSFPCMNPV